MVSIDCRPRLWLDWGNNTASETRSSNINYNLVGHDATKIMQLFIAIVDISDKLAHKMKINCGVGRIYLYKSSKTLEVLVPLRKTTWGSMFWPVYSLFYLKKKTTNLRFPSKKSAAHSNKCCYFFDCHPY